MPTKLIINADDFGLTNGVNRAVSELIRSRSLTSATLMANSSAFAEAVDIANAQPQLGVGCHIVLTDGAPVCAPYEVPTLLGKDRKNFRVSLTDFWISVLTGKISEADIEREATAQIRKIRNAGVAVTHVDTHKHTHVLPLVARGVLNAAEKLGVRAIRNPFEEAWSLRLSHGSVKRHVQVRLMSLLRKRFEALPQIQSGTVVTTDGTIGISATGRLDASVLAALLNHIPEGTWELVCHPGYSDGELAAVNTRLRETRDIEREALRNAFAETSSHLSALELIHYGMLASPSSATPSTQRADGSL